MTSVKFYRLDYLPTFDASKHEGVFVYLTAPYQTGNLTYVQGLWFGGSNDWELLTNVEGITLDDVRNWMNNGNQQYPFTGEADIFGTPTTSTTPGSIGTEYTIYDVLLDATGIRASSNSSDAHRFTVGNGALKISGKGATDTTGQTPSIPQASTNNVHSADDKVDSTLTLDDSLVWTPSTPSGSVGTIGVRTKTPVANNNLIVTEQDILSINGAMHLKGTLDSSTDWPTTANTTPGDTYIVTGAHAGPDGEAYEVGDTVVYYNDGSEMYYKVVNTNITTGIQHGQHAPVDMSGSSLAAGKLVIATNAGIATSNAQISDFITDIETTQTIADTAQDTADEGETHETTYTITTTITRPDGSDSDTAPDTETESHNITFHSNNNSLTIQEDTTNTDHQINFDLVWLTTMV